MNTNLITYHGTINPNVSVIRSQGLQSYRKSGLVYVTFEWARAATYARCWAVGLHAAGEIDKPVGAVLTLELPTDKRIRTGRNDDAAVRGHIAPQAIHGVELIDCSGIDEPTRVGLAVKLMGIIQFRDDPPTRPMWKGTLKKLRTYVGTMPEEVIYEGFQRSPML